MLQPIVVDDRFIRELLGSSIRFHPVRSISMNIDKHAEAAVEQATKSDLVWGAEGIAAVINRDARQTNHMLAGGLIPPAQKVGNKWVASRKALISFFGVAP